MKSDNLIQNMNEDEIKEQIDKYLVVRKDEKAKFGEVFTPIKLINEILDKLPSHVWKNKSYKWLEPASGIGNFPMVVYRRLMVSLKDEITDENARSKHIIENMLYMIELNKDNVSISKKIFGKNANIYCKSFLDIDVKNLTGVKTFDIIMGNPPFQENIAGNQKSRTLWNLFTLKSIDTLSKDGYLAFVHPSGWRSPTGRFKPVLNKIQERNLIYISMVSFDDGKKYFREVHTNLDIYILQNRLTNKNITKVNDMDNNDTTVDFNNWEFIPSGKFDVFKKILATKNDKYVDVLYSSSAYFTLKDYMSQKKTDKFKYPCCYSVTQAEGVKKFYSSKIVKDDDMFKVPKVMWSNGTGTYPVVDENGTYGLTQFCYAIKDKKENLKKIKHAMESSEFVELMKYAKFQNNRYDHKVIKLFKSDFFKAFKGKKFVSKRGPIKVLPKNKTKKVKKTY